MQAPDHDDGCYNTPRRATTDSVVEDGSSPRGPACSDLAQKLAENSLRAPRKRIDTIEGGYKRRRNRAFDPENLTISEFRMDARPNDDCDNESVPVQLRQNQQMNYGGGNFAALNRAVMQAKIPSKKGKSLRI